MAVSVVGINFGRTTDAKGFHCRYGRRICDRGACSESCRRHASDHQRRGRAAPRGSLQWSPGSLSYRSETGTGIRTNHSQHIGLLSEHDFSAHPSQVGRLQAGGSSSHSGSGLAPEAGRFTEVQRPYPFAYVPSLRQSDALGVAGCPTQSHGAGRSERHKQAEKASACSSGARRMENPRQTCSAVSNNSAHCFVLRIANQRDPRSPMDRFRLQTLGRSDSEISGGKTSESVKDRVFAGRGPSRKELHCCSEEVAGTLRENRTTMGFPESGDGTSVPRRLDPRRLPGSSRTQAGTWQDRVPHVSPHLPRVAGRNGGADGSAAEADATRSHLNHDGSVRKCFSNCQAKSQSANRATSPQKRNESADLDSIIKGNCGPVPLIGQFWTVATNAELPVTL